jgi:hypothetical protein
VQPKAEEDEEEEEEAAEPIWKNKWVLGAAAAAGLFFFYQSSQQPEQIQTVPIQQQGPNTPGQAPMQPGQVPGQPGQGPAPGQVPGQAPMQPGQMPGQMPGQVPGPMAGPGGAPGQPGPQQGGPALLQPPGGNLPTLSVQRAQDGSPVLFFQVQTRNGATPGMIALPANGWEAGPSMFGFMRAGTNGSQPDTMGMAVFQRNNSQAGPVRTAQPSWQQDNVGLGNICVAFIGPQGAQEVPLQGSTMCIMDANCTQAAGCGRVQ